MTFEVREIGSKRKFMLRVKGPQSEKTHLLAEFNLVLKDLQSEGKRLKAEVHVEGKGPS